MPESPGASAGAAPRTARRWACAHPPPHVGRIRPDYLQQLVGGPCLGHDVQPGVGEQTGDTFAEEDRIVSQGHPHNGAGAALVRVSGSAGSSAGTTLITLTGSASPFIRRCNQALTLAGTGL